MGMSLMSLLIALLFYDLSKRMGIAIIALTGVVRVSTRCSRCGAATWPSCLGRPWGSSSDEPRTSRITVAVVMLVLASTLMLLSEKGPGQPLGHSAGLDDR